MACALAGRASKSRKTVARQCFYLMIDCHLLTWPRHAPQSAPPPNSPGAALKAEQIVLAWGDKLSSYQNTWQPANCRVKCENEKGWSGLRGKILKACEYQVQVQTNWFLYPFYMALSKGYMQFRLWRVSGSRVRLPSSTSMFVWSHANFTYSWFSL